MNEQQLFLFFALGTALLTIFAVSISVLLLIHKQRQARHKTELLKTRLEEQEQSMSLISEEIHDNVGQILSLAKISLHKFAKYATDEEGAALLGNTRELITHAIDDLRHISHSLNSDRLQQTGLAASLELEMTHIKETGELQSSFEVKGTPYELEREQNLLVFRIVQEALQNVLKHAGATHVLLNLSYTLTGMRIAIEDNGKGFDVDKAKKADSLGLRNIQNRINLLRAELNIQSTPLKGTSVAISIPKTKY